MENQQTSLKLYTLSSRLLLLGEHCYLDSTDECYFTGVYTCHRDEGFKPLIISLKRNHKSAIDSVVNQLSSILPTKWAQNCTFVPMPPSSGKTSAIRSIVTQLSVNDVRDLVVQKQSTPSSHQGWRLSPKQRAPLLALNELQVEPPPRAVVMVDDVLTTGSHFRASRMVICQRWPGVRVMGLFLVRACSRRKESCLRARSMRPGSSCIMADRLLNRSDLP